MRIFGKAIVDAVEYDAILLGLVDVKSNLVIAINEIELLKDQRRIATNEMVLQKGIADTFKKSSEKHLNACLEAEKELDAQIRYNTKLEKDIKGTKINITTIPKAKPKAKKSTKRKPKK